MRDLELKKRQILDRINLLDLVSEHVRLKRSGRRWTGLCPFHAEKTPSFSVDPERGLFKCFGCGQGGDLFSFVQLRENVTFVEALRLLADRAGVEIHSLEGGSSSGPGRGDLAKANAWAAHYFRRQLEEVSRGRTAQAYLRSRNVAPEVAARFGLGWAMGNDAALSQAAQRHGFDRSLLLAADLVREGRSGRFYDTFRNRLMFPIRDATQRVIGFGGRTLVDDPAKYLNTAQNCLFDKGRSLYGLDLAREAITQRGRAVLVEGYMDCLAAHQVGITETVASLGTALTEAQVDALRRYCDQIIILFDSDRAGEAAAERAIRVALPRCVTVRLARVPEGQDPAEFLSRSGGEAFSDVLNRAIDALEFEWLQTQERFRVDGSDLRRREAVVDFLRMVGEAAEASAVDAIQRGLLVNQVAHLLRMDGSEVARVMTHRRPHRAVRTAPTSGQVGRLAHRVPVDAEQAAWTRVLEVLLNDPAVWWSTEPLLDTRRIHNALDRRILSVVLNLSEEATPFKLHGVLAHFHDPEEVRRVTELAERGAERGNWANTFASAHEQIRQAVEHEEWRRNRRARLKRTDDDRPAAGADHPTAVPQASQNHRQFVPRRLSRRIEAHVEVEDS